MRANPETNEMPRDEEELNESAKVSLIDEISSR